MKRVILWTLALGAISYAMAYLCHLWTDPTWWQATTLLWLLCAFAAVASGLG